MPVPAPASPAARIAALEAAYAHIAATRMAGLPLLQPGLRVQALGFAPQADAPQWLLGVLITPWFMNLLRLPLGPQAEPLALGERGARTLGQGARRLALDFIGAHEPALGGFEACSLFSPLHGFADQAAVVATAEAVLAQLRAATAAAAGASTGVPAAGPVPSRRGFLFGRGAAA